jgi:hypothetical protein
MWLRLKMTRGYGLLSMMGSGAQRQNTTRFMGETFFVLMIIK